MLLLEFGVMAPFLAGVTTKLKNLMNYTHHVVFWSTTHLVLGVTPPLEEVSNSISVNGVDHSQPFLYFVPQKILSQANSAIYGVHLNPSTVRSHKSTNPIPVTLGFETLIQKVYQFHDKRL